MGKWWIRTSVVSLTLTLVLLCPRSYAQDRSEQRDAKQAREAVEMIKNIQEELDEYALTLLDAKYADPFLQDYVNEIGQRLVPKETPPGVLFSFRVLNDPVPNAMALPDGRIFVNTGLLVFVENEAQLAAILGHEIGHVTQLHYVQSVRNAKREQLLGGIIGTAAGGVLGAIFGGKKGAAAGATAGLAGGLVAAKIRMNSYSRKQEDEADRIGAMLALDQHYDAREGVSFFQKLTATFGDQDRFSNALYGKHSRNVERVSNLQALLGGELGSTYNQQRTAGLLTNGSGEMHMYTSRMTRDVALSLMDDFDRYDLAKPLLERIVDHRAMDPKTLWALGRVYKLVGRTETDRAKALDLLQRAAQLDERNLYPFTHRELGLMQARMGNAPAAAESLKKYVLGHIGRHYEYPPDLGEVYDYLLTFGDHNWTAPAVEPLLVTARPRWQDDSGDAGVEASPAPKAPPARPPKGVKAAVPKKGGGGR